MIYLFQIWNVFVDGSLILEYLQMSEILKLRKYLPVLSIVSENIRNKVAHKIVMNLTENIIREWSKGKERSGIADAGLDSRDILNYLHRASDLIRGQKFQWDYDELNNSIIDSL